MMRYLDEVNAIKAHTPEMLKDAEFLRQLMKKHSYFIQFVF
jgi:hypothetical protein